MSLLYCRRRKAVAMIELIFAIVIMGIVLMSAPSLISQASKGSLGVVQQEAIVADATEIGMIMTRHWDEADTNESDYSPILIVMENITPLNENGATGKRIGTPQEASRGFVTSSGQRLNATPIGNEDGDEFDDIDDFDDNTSTLSVASGDTTDTETGDYIDTSLQITTNVQYIDAPDIAYTATTISFNQPFANVRADNNTSNIKAIQTTVTSGSHDAEFGTNITLRSFMCNIGTYTLEERTF